MARYVYTFGDVAYDTLEDAVAARANFGGSYYLDQIDANPMAGISVYVRAMPDTQHAGYEPERRGE